MKIAFVFYGLSGRGSGVGTTLMTYCYWLIKKGHEVRVISTYVETEIHDALVQMGVQVNSL